MLFDQFLAGLKEGDGSKIFSQVSAWHLATSILLISAVTLVIDYAYMLWMRSKLVSHEISTRVQESFENQD